MTSHLILTYTNQMLVSVLELQRYWSVRPRSLVHIGAHDAEELISYQRAGWNQVTWIEAQPSRILVLKNKLPSHHKLIQAAVWDLSDLIMTNTESTSLLELGTHAQEHPDIKLKTSIEVRTQTLENLLRDELCPEMIALDIQGAELHALRGYGERLREVKWIYCEVNRRELYQGCAFVEELDAYLEGFGFTRSFTKWTRHGWGDALYTNRSIVDSSSRFTRIALTSCWKVINLFRESKQILIRSRSSLKARFRPNQKKA